MDPGIDARVYLFPLCSSILGALIVVLEIIAVSTPYWAHFRRESSSLADSIAQDPIYEEGHYGLWAVCLSVVEGHRLPTEDCATNLTRFHPSSWRIFAGIIAIIDVVLLVLFLTTLPLQVRHLRRGTPTICKFKTLALAKTVLSLVGAICAVLVAVLFGIHSHHKNYQEPKGWSFGLQMVVIVLQATLFLLAVYENSVAKRVDNAKPAEVQYTLKVDAPSSGGKLTEFSSIGSILTGSSVALCPSEDSGRESPLARTNPLFVDSDNEEKSANGACGSQRSSSSLPCRPLPHISVDVDIGTVRSFSSAGGNFELKKHSTAGRFRVEKVADLYSSSR